MNEVFDDNHHLIFGNEKPLEQLWAIAKKYRAEKEIKEWINDYTQSAWISYKISKTILASVSDEKDYLTHVKESCLTKLGRSICEIAHTWVKQSDEMHDEYEFGITVILPRKKRASL